MNLRYGKADENVLKRSVADVILHERQKIAAYDELKKDAGSGPAPGGSGRTGSLFSEIRTGILRSQPLCLLKNPIGILPSPRYVSEESGQEFCRVSMLPGIRDRDFAIRRYIFGKNAGGLSVIRAVNKLAAEKIRACTFFP